MGTFSIWHWIIVLIAVLGPFLGIIRGVQTKSSLNLILSVIPFYGILYFFIKRKPKVDFEKEFPIEITDQSKLVRVNFIKRYWEGNVSLPISYWIVSWCTAIFVFTGFLALEKFIEGRPTFSPIVLFGSFGSAYLFVTAIIFWQTIGVLRSAINHTKNPIKTKAWGYLAILAILGGVVKNYTTYQNNIVPQMVAMYRIAILSDPDIPPYKITVVENGRELLIEGGIKHGLMEDVKKALILAPSITTINLESIGGRHGEAIDLYNLISQRGLNTVTNKGCMSACTIVFAAGKNRWVGTNGWLGFHSSSFEGMSDKDANEATKSIFQKIHKEKGIPLSFLKKGNKVSSKKMWRPTIDELHLNNFITSKFSPAISSLRIMERSLIAGTKELKSSLPKQLDIDTTLIDIRVKFNRLTSIHTLSENVINRVRNLGLGWQFLEKHVIKNACKSKAIRDDQEIGVEYEYVYLHPTTKSNIFSIKLPKKCP